MDDVEKNNKQNEESFKILANLTKKLQYLD